MKPPNKMPQHLINERRMELNRAQFPSEMWFKKILSEAGIINGYSQNLCLDNRYFGDFVWQKHKVVIEIDGSSHNDRKEYDDIRDNHLRSFGYKVYRIRWGNVDACLKTIDLLKGLLSNRVFKTSDPQLKGFKKKLRKKKRKQEVKKLLSSPTLEKKAKWRTYVQQKNKLNQIKNQNMLAKRQERALRESKHVIGWDNYKRR